MILYVYIQIFIYVYKYIYFYILLIIKENPDLSVFQCYGVFVESRGLY